MQRLTVVAAAASLMLAACGGSSSGGKSSAASTVSNGPATVTVKGFAFEPGDLTVRKGTKVTWNFRDTAKHNVTSSDDKFKSTDLQTGSYSYTFNSVGRYDYFCSIHQYMKGTVTVR